MFELIRRMRALSNVWRRNWSNQFRRLLLILKWQTPVMEFDEICSRSTELAIIGADLSMRLADNETPKSGSHLMALKILQLQSLPNPWRADDVDFIAEALKGLLGIAGSQLRGMSRLVYPGAPVMLHPLVTTVRGVAEACGTIAWLVNPWIVSEGEQEEGDDDVWWNVSQSVLARSELLQLEARINRVKRLSAAFTIGQPNLDTAIGVLENLRAELETNHGIDNVKVRSNQRQALQIGGQTFETYSDLVSMAVEYSHGAKYRGTGMKPYPLFSGFAHPSLEVLFSQAPLVGRPGMSALFEAELGEVRDLMVQGLRLVEAHYEMVAMTFGLDLGLLDAYRDGVREFVEETMPDG
jgi:hypothetical protein